MQNEGVGAGSAAAGPGRAGGGAEGAGEGERAARRPAALPVPADAPGGGTRGPPRRAPASVGGSPRAFRPFSRRRDPGQPVRRDGASAPAPVPALPRGARPRSCPFCSGKRCPDPGCPRPRSKGELRAKPALRRARRRPRRWGCRGARGMEEGREPGWQPRCRVPPREWKVSPV